MFEQIFNVDGFLKYLAVNNVIQNWDTYGIMTHNYFLYNDGGVLTWIPWDNNESFQEGKQGGALSLEMNEVSDNWPLIRYLMDIDEYYETYLSHVETFTNSTFDINTITTRLTNYQNVIQSYAGKENSNFSGDINSLKSYIQTRNTAAKGFTD